MDTSDLLALAIESVENESQSNIVQENSKTTSSTKKKRSLSPNGRKNLPNSFNDDEDDILAVALADIENEAGKTNTGNKLRTLIGVDLCFDPDPEPQVDNTNSKIDRDKSVVHTGDTDSSDDEDNKYFQEARYDSYGRSIKQCLQKAESDKSKRSSSTLKEKVSKCNNTPSFITPKPAASCKDVHDVTADPVFGIRIINPLVSSESMKRKMYGTKPIGFYKLKSHVVHGDLKSDWAVAAVVVDKLPPKVSKNGSTYSMWILSDLKHDLKTASLFLFGSAHEDLWKTPRGTVVVIQNPAVLSDNKKSDYEAKLSIRTSDQVMIWGKSKDLGHCPFRKKDGDICGKFVNVAQCEFCVFHVKQEYRKFNSRADFGNSCKINLRNKILGKDEVFYGGKSFTAIPIVGKKASNPKDKSRLQGLGAPSVKVLEQEELQIPNLQRSNKILKLLGQGNLTDKRSDEKRLSSLKPNSSSSLRPVSNENLQFGQGGQLKQCLAKLENTKPSLSNPAEISFDIDCDSVQKNTSNSLITVKPPVKVNKKRPQQRFNSLFSIPSVIGGAKKKSVFSSTPSSNDSQKSSLSPERPNKNPIKLLPSTPTNNNNTFKKSSKMSPALKPGAESSSSNTSGITSDEKSVIFDVKTPERNEAFSPSMMSTPVQGTTNTYPQNQSGSIRQQRSCNLKTIIPPNAGMSQAKLKALAYVRNKGPISKENSSGSDPSKKGVKRRLSATEDETEGDQKPVLSERFIQLMNQKSIREDLVAIRELEQENDYFEKMEKKDRLEEKMLNTFKVECKAVRCLKCDYIWFSVSDACKAEGHPTKVVDAVKRFFKCGQCDNRTISLTLIPLIPCKKCSSSNWKRAPMIREKLAKNDSLSIRGGEQKFVNSVTTNGSLNLLVPD